MAEIIITKKMLEPFVSKDGSRPALENVFRQKGYVVASDGHILIRVPEGMVKDFDAIPLQATPNVDAIVREDMPLDIPLTKALIEKKIKEAPQVREKETCEDCQGTGKVEWNYEDKEGFLHTEKFDCPVCKGRGYLSETGRMVPDPEQLFSLAGGLMNTECLDAIIKVMEAFKVSKVAIRASDNYKAMFTIGDIQVLRTFVILDEDARAKLDDVICIK